jgi:thiol-disulfide isomerase/thioredoxin
MPSFSTNLDRSSHKNCNQANRATTQRNKSLVIFSYSSSLTVSAMPSRTTAATTTMMLPLLALAFLMLPAIAFQAPSTTQRPTTRHNYAITADPPSANPSFEDRMRDLTRKKDQEKRRAEAAAPNKKNQGHLFGLRPSFLKEVSTLQEYNTVVADEVERISVVRFYSASCRSCKGATPAFDALARKYPDLNWVEVPVTQDNAALHQGLGVPSVPFGHVYVPDAGLVEELRLVRPQMKRFGKVLKSYVEGQVDLPETVNPETGIFEAPF